jgi:hypothetical protein
MLPESLHPARDPGIHVLTIYLLNPTFGSGIIPDSRATCWTAMFLADLSRPLNKQIAPAKGRQKTMLIDDPFNLIRGGKVTELTLAPVEAAPVQSGKSFGPCLLGPAFDAEWVIGHWDGHGWYCDDGSPVSPIVWAMLPPIGEVMTMARPATLAGAIAILEQVSKDEDQIHPEAIRNVVVFLQELTERHAIDGVGP